LSETLLWDLMRGPMTAKAIGWAADLKIAEALAEGPRPVAELALSTGVDAATLHRTLRALASDGVFAEDEPGVFHNTEASELLGRDGWPEFAHLFGGVFYEMLSRFPEPFEPDFWAWLAEHPAERAAFDTAMAAGKERYSERLAALDWDGTETVVDVGGGNGALLRGMLARRPDLHGIVFDLPETVRDESTFGERLEFVAGSFFEAVPVAPQGARLLLIESIVPAGNEPQGSKWLDLLMLVLGGRERTEADWRELVDAAGFAAESVEDGLIQARCR
jgi:hypothetical protein